MVDDVGQHEQTLSSARLVKAFANAPTLWQGVLQPEKRSQASFGNLTANQTQRWGNTPQRLIPRTFSRTMDRHWAALIALSLDALSSDKKLKLDLSQGGAFPTINSWGHKKSRRTVALGLADVGEWVSYVWPVMKAPAVKLRGRNTANAVYGILEGLGRRQQIRCKHVPNQYRFSHFGLHDNFSWSHCYWFLGREF